MNNHELGKLAGDWFWYRSGSNGLVSATSRDFGLEESEVEVRDDAVKQDADQANDADVDGGVCLFSL